MILFANFDRQIENQIVKHQMLEDDTINLAQHILFKQFKCVNGLELTNLPPSQFSSMQENFVQILHVFENHWIIIYGLEDLKTKLELTIRLITKKIKNTLKNQ